MDYIFTILLFVLYVIIVVIYIFNSTKAKYDLKESFQKLLLEKPDSISFSLGFNKEKNAFKNVYPQSKGDFIIKFEKYPVSTTGQLIIQENYGQLIENSNGYKISGIKPEFKCLDGYEGPNCQPKSLCDDGDENKLKPLTNRQFNQLGLYGMSSEKFKPIENQFTTSNLDKPHPRIRVNCGKNKTYTLETCPKNKLLDINLNCQIYDICEDSLNGLRHNLKINDYVLKDNEFYVCLNNKSKLTECTDNTVYNKLTHSCEQKSRCLGQGDKQIQIDETHYIQCDNNREREVFCERGIVRKDDKLFCKPNVEEKTYTFEDNVIKFNYGRIWVDENNEKKTIFCDKTPQEVGYSYNRGDSFSYMFKNWPKQVLSTNNVCIDPSEANSSLIRKNDAKDSFKWGNVMSEFHPYNPFSLQFYCDTKYKWDYKSNKTIPEIDYTRYLLDPSTPCNNDLISLSQDPFFGMDFSFYPEKDVVPILYGIKVIFPKKLNLSFWPTKINNKYHGTIIEYDFNGRFLILKTCTSTSLPYKCEDRTNNIVDIIGYKSFTNTHSIDLMQSNYWLIANQNKLSTFTFETPTCTNIIYTMPLKINSKDITNYLEFCILWPLITKTITFDKNFIIEPSGLIINSVQIGKPLTIIRIERIIQNKLTIQTGDTNMCVIYNEFQVDMS